MVPLVGTQCGSPTGVPFAFADPGRTVERLNPYDPEHANHTMVISGRSGSGKRDYLCGRLDVVAARSILGEQVQGTGTNYLAGGATARRRPPAQREVNRRPAVHQHERGQGRQCIFL